MIPQCLLDMDGVLVDFVGGAHAVHNRRDYVYDKPNARACWDIMQLFEMTPEYFWKPMGEEFWAKLEWTPDGKEILALVEQLFGNNVCILTSPCLNYGCSEGKLRWIERHIPKYKRKNLMGNKGKDGALEFCTSPQRILVDDSDANVQLFKSYGGHTALVPRPWNKLYETKDVVSHLRKELDNFLYVINE